MAIFSTTNQTQLPSHNTKGMTLFLGPLQAFICPISFLSRIVVLILLILGVSTSLISTASAQALARGEDGRTFLVESQGDGRFVPLSSGSNDIRTSSDGSRSLYVTAPQERSFHIKENSSLPYSNKAGSSNSNNAVASSNLKTTIASSSTVSKSSSHNVLPQYSGTGSSQNANLPVDLYTKAVMEEVEADEDFNYNKVQKISSLPVYPKGYRAAKNLVDKVVVNKMEHAMYLYKGDHLVRKYWIALSDRPRGTKIQEGDRRTPEGAYTLDYVKNDSYYYRAFHISYPNPDDIARARARGVRPGGMIMVHGQPPSGKEYQDTVQRSDWTNGCIALLNPEMDEFINLVDPGTLIVINP